MKKNIKENLSQIKEICSDILPKNRTEGIILLIFAIFYLSYSYTLAINTSIIDYKDLLYDVYFSFDNPIIYRQGYVYMEGHPLMIFITYPFILIGNVLLGLLGYKAKTLFLTGLCTLLISFSSIYVYRYLTYVIELKNKISYTLLIFYALTSTNLILAFTPESFTITVFILSFTVYYYSFLIKQKRDVRLAANTLFAVLLGGITITNFAKGIIPIVFTQGTKRTIIRKILIVSAVFSLTIIWMQIQYDFISLIKGRLNGNISIPAQGTYFERVFEWLYAAPLFFPAIRMLSIKIDGLPFTAISLDFYHHWWQYMFAIVLLICICISAYKNYKNPLVQLIGLLLLEDIIIHAIIRYGLRDAFIYGGHWVFAIPILLGWLYKNTDTSPNLRKILNYLIPSLVLYLAVNNIYRLNEFITTALNYFPPY